ncbi:hypothetical protein A2303_02285 [Candidatus Falkowbacteria bacterium RIFOXYB2_FULL_47_14]|uniref:Uncharacterized protein n=1 Tax=Candidatus Falkowbacteria bacterium RIFOXYA2_FULL_47_19 TaxID=1797994 RepID=A0A1F5SEX9_9BACT|nr:MAG: hypothetical protein A2227_07460 [Candidatus Falkowbacteria bacterium RIFOXYA2_FULL_47_19]OGF35249.1 MAG: hypothetical protein A2468_01090 [Candidatus Falkowbacteria bacterium RIFOXYC2_FULL_46_15]OGF43891.1 MAG: hypothetical protein A2303_02285 [Candidatus Falkowbacteria bacterium RIFOXYB2_FULL_47_14]
MENINNNTNQGAKQDTLELFEGNLGDVFELDDYTLLEELNDDIIDFIAVDVKFKNELEYALYKNPEKLTHKTFILDGSPHAPSVRNWLRDFIRTNGSGIFDNVALTKYVTYSPNCQRLDDFEKEMVRKLLSLYRNLKFFPESLNGVPVEKWEIIPIEREEDLSKARSVAGAPRTEEEKEIDELKKEEENYEAGGLERMAIEEEISEEAKIEDLRIEANKYPAGSLERKALDEEIRKMEKRIVRG